MFGSRTPTGHPPTDDATWPDGMSDTEEFEHLPWAELPSAADDRGRRMLYTAAAAVALSVVGLLAARILFSAPTAEIPIVAQAGLGDASAIPTDAGPAAADGPAMVVGTASDGPAPDDAALGGVADKEPAGGSALDAVGEVDLRASPAGVEPVLVAEVAAAFLGAWYGEGGEVDGATLDALYRGSADLRDAARPGEAPSGRSYVERVHVVAMDRVGSGRWAVTALVGRLIDDGAGFRRTPLETVGLVVEVESGGAVVVDGPTLEALVDPDGSVMRVPRRERAPAGVAVETVDVPDAAMVAVRGLLGSEGSIVSIRDIAEGWRFLVVVDDPVGRRWPYVLRVDDLGRPLPMR